MNSEIEKTGGIPDPDGMNLSLFAMSNLRTVAAWASFLAIVGFIFIGLMVIAAFGMFVSGGMMYGGMSTGMGGFIYLLFALIGFFPALYLYRFSILMKKAVAQHDALRLDYSCSNLKKYFRYVGILTIIMHHISSNVHMAWRN